MKPNPPASRLRLLVVTFACSMLLALPWSDAASAEPGGLAGNVIRVGPKQKVTTIGEAARIARTGDTVEIEAGDYAGDVAVWDQDLVRIVGVGGRPRVVGAGRVAEGKGLFLVRARAVEIENIEFVGARAPDHYGSAVRLERGSVRIAKSKFVNNEFAVLTANDPAIVLEIQDCEFSGLVDAANRGQALSHTIYAGKIDSFRLEGSYLHRGALGHLVKTRARNNLIRYNRITDEDGISSYELEFPEGGVATVVGNLIQQGARTENRVIVSYGAESLGWRENRLDLFFNTLVNESGGAAAFVFVHAGNNVRIRHNVLVGPGEIKSPAAAGVGENVGAAASEFADAAHFDYRPRTTASWAGTATGVDRLLGADVLPAMEYLHVASTRPLPRRAGIVPFNPGAFQSFGR